MEKWRAWFFGGLAHGRQHAEGCCAQEVRRRAAQESLPAVVTAQPRQRGWGRPEHEFVWAEALPQGCDTLLRPGFNGLFAGAAPAKDHEAAKRGEPGLPPLGPAHCGQRPRSFGGRPRTGLDRWAGASG